MDAARLTQIKALARRWAEISEEGDEGTEPIPSMLRVVNELIAELDVPRPRQFDDTSCDPARWSPTKLIAEYRLRKVSGGAG